MTTSVLGSKNRQARGRLHAWRAPFLSCPCVWAQQSKSFMGWECPQDAGREAAQAERSSFGSGCNRQPMFFQRISGDCEKSLNMGRQVAQGINGYKYDTSPGSGSKQRERRSNHYIFAVHDNWPAHDLIPAKKQGRWLRVMSVCPNSEDQIKPAKEDVLNATLKYEDDHAALPLNKSFILYNRIMACRNL